MTISIHHSAICESQSIGNGTRIWAFTHILPGARIGTDCNICDFVFVENDVQIGDRVTIKSGVQLWDGARIEDDVFVGPNVSFTNDKFPRSRQWLDTNLVTTVMRGASIGAGSTILPGITIGERAMIGAGSVVTKSVPPFAIVFGNPAKINGYVQGHDIDDTKGILPAELNDNEVAFPGGARLIPIQSVSEDRGALAIIEFSKFDAFFVKRVFFINQVPAQGIRGEHAHRACSQFLIALAGELSVSMDDGLRKKTVVLSSSNLGLLIPPMTWSTQYDFSPGSVLAVLASHEYDENDYLRDYAAFKAAI